MWLFFLRRQVFVWYRTERLDWTGGAITSTPAQCHLSSLSRDHAASRLDMCVWVGVCLTVCQRSLTPPSPLPSLPTQAQFTIKFHLWKFMRRKQSPKESSCAQFLFVAVSLCGKYVHICTYRASAGWRIHQQYTIHRAGCLFPPPLSCFYIWILRGALGEGFCRRGEGGVLISLFPNVCVCVCVCVCVRASVLVTSKGALLCLSASSLIHY